MDLITNISIIVLVAALLLPPISNHLCKHSQRLDKAMKYSVLSIYLLINLYETILFRAVKPDPKFQLELLWSYRVAISISPSISISNFSLLQEIILNILLYIPFGYLLPFVFERLRFWQVVLICFLCSVATEVCQLVFHIGLFELDDMLNNTMGAIIGAGMYLLVAGIAHKRGRT